MPFDPTLPAANSPNSSAQMRGQLTALADLIAAVPAGPPGADGPPGEVSAADLLADHANHARNPTGVSALGLTVSDPPTQAEMQALAGKVDELLTALRREP
jgi:hypothetical protein